MLPIFDFLRKIFFFGGYFHYGMQPLPKPLSRSKEQEYLLQYQKGDPEAREKLIEHNLRLVAHIAKKYAKNTSDMDDYISIGTIGLIKGINTFDCAKGAQLATYIARCIENAMQFGGFD